MDAARPPVDMTVADKAAEFAMIAAAPYLLTMS
jgi:hypothetical protein